jgi:uncharacterized metal-binding protein YceD (DUF177 family)
VSDELEWNYAIEDIPETGLQADRAATPEERATVARALDVLSVLSLSAQFAITPRSAGYFRLTGNVKAQVEQSCVVTLEPLTNEIDERFSVDYWPENELPEPSGGVIDVHDEPDLEPIVGNQIKVGRVVFDTLAGAIDLFPRKPGVTFESSELTPKDTQSQASGPFAVLAKMKNKR